MIAVALDLPKCGWPEPTDGPGPAFRVVRRVLRAGVKGPFRHLMMYVTTSRSGPSGLLGAKALANRRRGEPEALTQEDRGPGLWT